MYFLVYVHIPPSPKFTPTAAHSTSPLESHLKNLNPDMHMGLWMAVHVQAATVVFCFLCDEGKLQYISGELQFLMYTYIYPPQAHTH